MTPNEIYDLQLLHMIESWADLRDYMVTHALLIPESEIEEWAEFGTLGGNIAYNHKLKDSAIGMIKAARSLVSEAENAGLIEYEDWRIINLILLFAGTDVPLTDVLYPCGSEDAYDDNPAF